MTNKATIGTINQGTLRSQDLLEAFADELDRLDTDGEHGALLIDARHSLACLESGDDATEAEQEYASQAAETIAELIDALNGFAPPYCYFGTTEGDGSDFGFWSDVESLEDDARGGDVLKIADGDDVAAAIRERGNLPDYVMSVSDHGNVTLYAIADVALSEIWAVV